MILELETTSTTVSCELQSYD